MDLYSWLFPDRAYRERERQRLRRWPKQPVSPHPYLAALPPELVRNLVYFVGERAIEVRLTVCLFPEEWRNALDWLTDEQLVDLVNAAAISLIRVTPKDPGEGRKSQ